MYGVCKVCGCTDTNACPGGCYWVDMGHTLCSRCAHLGDRKDARKKFTKEEVEEIIKRYEDPL